MYKHLGILTTIFTAFLGICSTAFAADAPKPLLQPSATILLRGMISIGPSTHQTPYARIVVEQAGIYGTEDPIHLHPTFVGAEVPIIHERHGFLAALELTGLVGVLWEARLPVIALRQFMAFQFRENPGSFMGHMAMINEQVMVIGPDGKLAAAPIWTAGLFNMNAGRYYVGARMSGNAIDASSLKGGPALAVKLDTSSNYFEAFLLPSVEFGPGGNIANLVAIFRVGKSTNYVPPAPASAAPAQLSGPAPLALLPGHLALIERTERLAEKARATSETAGDMAAEAAEFAAGAEKGVAELSGLVRTETGLVQALHTQLTQLAEQVAAITATTKKRSHRHHR